MNFDRKDTIKLLIETSDHGLEMHLEGSGHGLIFAFIQIMESGKGAVLDKIEEAIKEAREQAPKYKRFKELTGDGKDESKETLGMLKMLIEMTPPDMVDSLKDSIIKIMEQNKIPVPKEIQDAKTKEDVLKGLDAIQNEFHKRKAEWKKNPKAAFSKSVDADPDKFEVALNHTKDLFSISGKDIPEAVLNAKNSKDLLKAIDDNRGLVGSVK